MSEEVDDNAAHEAARRMHLGSSFENNETHMRRLGVGHQRKRANNLRALHASKSNNRRFNKDAYDSHDDEGYDDDGELYDEDELQEEFESDNPYEVDSRTLDFNGPKLMRGIKSWIFFLQIIGQVNWHNRPLIFSLIYKILINAFMIWRYLRISGVLYMYSLNGSSFKNPIFLFIGSTACFTFLAQGVVAFRMSLLDLCPMYKILCTEGLCFVKVSSLKQMGSNKLPSAILFFIYNALISQMFAHKNFDAFVKEFNIFESLMDAFAHFVFDFIFISVSPIDLYIRVAFASWLLGLKNYLQEVFEKSHEEASNNLDKNLHLSSMPQNQSSLNNKKIAVAAAAAKAHRFMTFDDIQRCLNNMDDHLEAFRSVQTGVLVTAVLNAFLCIGSLTLMTYNLLVDQADYYHGTLMFLTVVNFNVLFFTTYCGDELISQALRSFVQAIENEYFTRDSGMITGQLHASDNEHPQAEQLQHTQQQNQTNSSQQQLLDEHENIQHSYHDDNQNLLRIRKRDVLFCREFLHQFENHLHTPWSKVTFKGHIHLIRAFFTLMAAQIIFTTEH